MSDSEVLKLTKLSGFSIDKLLTFLALLNQDIEVNIKPD